MSAHAWQRRRESKRFRMGVERAIRILAIEPAAVVHLAEWGLVVISPGYYECLTQGLLST